MKLIIYFDGDPSVGISPQQWEIECPFEREDVYPEELGEFKQQVKGLYRAWTGEQVTATYDFELSDWANE